MPTVASQHDVTSTFPDSVRRMAKVELHCHFDCGLRLETAADIAAETGVPLPASLRDALVAPEVCADLGD